MANTGTIEGAVEVPPASSIRAELGRVLESATFASSDRLQAFLNYVVSESLASRGHLIVGKTIAYDVYDRKPDEGSDSIVRVDAGRLRRKLYQYYNTEGAENPVRIYIDSGGYAPRFEEVTTIATQETLEKLSQGSASVQSRSSPPRVLVTIFAIILVGLSWVFLAPKQELRVLDTAKDESARNQAERVALADKSIATLQAANLSEKASGLLFPIANVEHQKLAISMYREAISIDPRHSDGYAGVGHSLATLALLAPDPETQEDLLKQAGEFAQQAIDLDPLNGWSQSTAAWVAFVKGNYDQAVDLSNRAALLDDMDGKTLDFHAVILALTGNFEESSKVSDPKYSRNNRNRHPAHLNIHGVANFHMENYEAAIASFNAALREGGPVSQLTLMYKAAAKQANGDNATAEALLEELRASWPNFRPDVAADRFYQYSEHAEQLLSMLRAAGWSVGQ